MLAAAQKRMQVWKVTLYEAKNPYEWEYAEARIGKTIIFREGEVSVNESFSLYYSLDEENSEKMKRTLIKWGSTSNILRVAAKFSKKFSGKEARAKFTEFCDDNGIDYAISAG